MASVGVSQGKKKKNKTPKTDLGGTSLVPFEEIFVRGFSEK